MNDTLINTSLTSLKSTLKGQYGFADPEILAISGDNLRNVYKILQGEKTYILRSFSKRKTKEAIERDIAVLLFLEEKKFPAPRIMKTLGGESIVEINDGRAILTTYIEGDIVLNTPESLFQMGELMARLHVLDTDDYSQESNWSVDKERKVIEKNVSTLNTWTTEQLEIISDVLHALQQVPLLDDLPKSIIHSDIHRKNMIKTPGEEYYLIDWDDAGIGTTILDLAEVLSQVCIRFEDEELYKNAFMNRELAEAFMKGYYSVKKLSTAEKAAMIDAMKFTALAYVIQYWNSEISIGDWRRYQLEKEQGEKLIEGIL